MIQALANGLISGLGIATLGLALQLVYLPTGILFFAIAGLFTLAPYLTAAGLDVGLSAPAAIACSLFGVAGLSLLMERLSHGPLTRRDASPSAHLVVSLGYYTLLVHAVSLGWGSQPRILGSGAGRELWHLGSIAFSTPQLVMAAGASFVLALSTAVVQYTAIGLKLRALADNADQFRDMGYDPWRYRGIVFAVSGTLAAASSLLLASDVGFAPSSGLNPVLYAFVGLIVGGRHALFGALVGGVVVGVVRTEVGWLLSARWQDAAVFLLMAVFLMVAPEGMLGHKARVEVR